MSALPRLDAAQRALLVAAFLCALNLRPQLIGIGPLIPLIQRDLQLSFAVAGLLVTIPVLCMGIFALPGGAVLRYVGSYRGIAAALAAIGVFGVLRGLAPGGLTLLALTFGVGLGMGVAGVLLPVVVGERFPGRAGLATGVYATGIQTGSTASAAVAVPIAAVAAGGWRTSLTVFSVAALLLAGVWFLAARDRAARQTRQAPRVQGLPVRNPLAWVLVGLFALASAQYYGMSAWLAAAYVERGWTAAAAGGLIATMNATAIPAGLVVTWTSDRFPSRAPFLIGCGVAMLTSVLGIVLLPAGGWLWAGLFGMAQGGIFALMLTLPVDLGREPREVAAYAGMMFAGGYVLTAVSPVGLGAIRDLTGDFATSLWALVAVAVLVLVAFVGYARLSQRWHAVEAQAAPELDG